jgi:segregation and condensation protein A
MSLDQGEVSAAEREVLIALPVFEGPLDLLLHLIQKHELDIADIPVSFVTQKYLEYLALMENLAIDLASEYLVMAATLVHIKSKSLLPPDAVVEEDDVILGEEGDPREELIRRLLEYQKYKQAALDLNGRGALGRDIFLRGQPSPEAEGPAPLAKVEVWNLLDAFAKVLARSEVDLQHEVSFDRMSITERIQELCVFLADKSSCKFEDLFEGKRTRFDMVITFLALLEMTRLKLTRVRQAGPLEDIYIDAHLSGAELPSDAKPEEEEALAETPRDDAAPADTGPNEPLLQHAALDETPVYQAALDNAELDEPQLDDAALDELELQDDAALDEPELQQDDAELDEPQLDDTALDESRPDEAAPAPAEPPPNEDEAWSREKE